MIGKKQRMRFLSSLKTDAAAAADALLLLMLLLLLLLLLHCFCCTASAADGAPSAAALLPLNRADLYQQLNSLATGHQSQGVVCHRYIALQWLHVMNIEFKMVYFKHICVQVHC